MYVLTLLTFKLPTRLIDTSTGAGEVHGHVCTRRRLPVKWKNSETDTLASFRK